MRQLNFMCIVSCYVCVYGIIYLIVLECGSRGDACNPHTAIDRHY